MMLKKNRTLIILSTATLLLLTGCGISSSQFGSSAIESLLLENSRDNKDTFSVFMTAEVSEELPKKSKLYIKGDWDGYSSPFLLNLTEGETFIYNIEIPAMTVGKHYYYFLLDKDENYKEYLPNENSYFELSENQRRFYHKIDGFISLPEEVSDWTILNGKEQILLKEYKDSITIENYSWLGGIVAKENNFDNYQMKASFRGTKESPYTDETYIGMCPWYVDTNNYLILYCQWCNWEGYTNKMREIGITGFIGGNSVGWNDFWPSLDCTISPKDGFELVVTKRGTNIAFSLTSGSYSFEGNKSFASIEARSTYLGLWSQNDIVEVKNYETKEAEDFTPLFDDEWFSNDSSNNYEIKDQNSLVISNNQWLNGFTLRKDENAIGNYTVSSHIQGTLESVNATNAYMGLIPYYRDDQNYVVFYMQWLEGKVKSLGVTGYVSGVWLSWNDLWDYNGMDISPKDGFDLSINVNDGVFTSTLNDKTASVFFDSLKDASTIYVGQWSQGDTVTYTNFNVEK